jgi:hypothetical protein
MLIEVVTQAHGPRLHRPDHHESRQGHRVVTAIDVLRSPPRSAPGTHSPPGRPGTRKNIPLRRARILTPHQPTAPPRVQRDQHDAPGQPTGSARLWLTSHPRPIPALPPSSHGRRNLSVPGPLPGHNASTRPEHQRPGTRRAVGAREPQITAGHRLRIDRKRARPYDGHGRHRPGSLLAVGAIRVFPDPEDVPPAVATTGITSTCCPGPTARCVRHRTAREAPFRNMRRSANVGDAEVDA